MRFPLVTFLLLIVAASGSYAAEPRVPTDSEIKSVQHTVTQLKTRVTAEDLAVSARCKKEWINDFVKGAKVSAFCATPHAGDIRKFMSAVWFCERLLARTQALRNPISAVSSSLLQANMWNFDGDLAICQYKVEIYGGQLESQ